MEHPEEVPRADGGVGDIIDRGMDEVRELTQWNDDTILPIEWKSVIIFARKR